MSQQPPVARFRSLKSLAKTLRRDLKGVHARRRTPRRKGTRQVKGKDFVLLFAHNGVGKTRLSMEFKDLGKSGEKRDTLYFNAFTEDLFDWDNDLDEDEERRIKFKSQSHFFDGLEGMGIESLIRPHLHRYADFNFTIDYADSEIRFFRDAIVNGRSVRHEDIKISRGEENVFIWCFFLAILQLACEAEKGEPYDWVKFVYIDDPISSLDDNNTITLASDLAGLLKGAHNGVKAIISTHHGLFFNVMFNALKGKRTVNGTGKNIEKKSYFLHRPSNSLTYSLHDTAETPLLHHVATLGELQRASKSGKISQHHFNSLRSLLEKTAIFFGHQHMSTCFNGCPEKELFSRFLNVRSHAKYSVFEADLLNSTEREMFREILDVFISRYHFNPALLSDRPAPARAVAAEPTAGGTS